MAWRREQLLGPQRHHPHPCLRRPRRLASAAGAQAVRRPRAQPRFRRSSADAPWRLGRAHGAVPGGQLRRRPADPDRPAGARPSLVPGQPAARQGGRQPWPALDQPHPHADRHRPLLHRADVGDADADRHCDPAVPGRHRFQRPAAPVTQRVLAGPGRGAGGAPVRRHHGRAAAAQGAGLSGDAAGPCRPPRLRRCDPCVRVDAGGDRAGRTDGTGSDVRAVARRGRSAVRPRFRLGRTAA